MLAQVQSPFPPLVPARHHQGDIRQALEGSPCNAGPFTARAGGTGG